MISQHLPVLHVVIPLLSAPFCVLFNRSLLPWCIALCVVWCSFAIAVLLLQDVLVTGEIVYVIGGWAAPWGIEYRLDILNTFVLLIVTGIAAIVITFARASINREIPENKIYLFYTVFLLNFSGLCGVVATGDAFNVFVFVEIASLSSYAMISLGRSRQALVAAYRYLILGTIAATFILIGIGLLYAMTGTLNIVDMAERLRMVENTRTVATAFTFFTVGFCIKFGLFPLHFWLPNAYTYAPLVVSAFLSGTTSKVFIYVLLRFLFDVFGADYVFDLMSVNYVLMALALLAVFSGSLAAIFQDNIKRMLAWSSIAEIGYIIIGISLVSELGIASGILHLFNHALIKTALFMVVGCLFFHGGSFSIEQLRGAGREMPFTMLAFVIAGLSLIGVPLTAGSISKWFLILAALEHNWWLVAFVMATTLMTVVYIWKVVEALYFSHDRSGQNKFKRGVIPLSMLIPLWVIILANIYFGVNALLTTGIARQAADYLLSIQ